MDSKCDHVVPLLAPAVDDQLTDEQWEVLEQHIANCESCRTLYRQQQEAVLKLEGLDPRFIEKDLWPSVEHALPKETTAKRAKLYWLIGIVALGVLFKPIDLFFISDSGIVSRFGVFLVVSLLFALAKENPFRIASDAELGIIGEETQREGA